MRAQELVILVRTEKEAEIVRDAAGEGGALHKARVQVAGAPGALQPAALKKLRRSPDPDQRRAPVLVWAAHKEAEAAWRNAGAYVLGGPLTRAGAAKAVEAAFRNLGPWVESQAYVGPCRRRHQAWLKRPTRRLADSRALKPEEAGAEQSLATRLRQLRTVAFSLPQADLDRRAQFLADVRSGVAAADRSRRLHAAHALRSLERYLAARGAHGEIDPKLVERHIDVAEGPAVDAPPRLAALLKLVDRAIGLAA